MPRQVDLLTVGSASVVQTQASRIAMAQQLNGFIEDLQRFDDVSHLSMVGLSFPKTKLFPVKPTTTSPNLSHDAARQVGWSKIPAG